MDRELLVSGKQRRLEESKGDRDGWQQSAWEGERGLR